MTQKILSQNNAILRAAKKAALYYGSPVTLHATSGDVTILPDPSIPPISTALFTGISIGKATIFKWCNSPSDLSIALYLFRAARQSGNPL